MRILIAEDDKITRKILEKILTDAGHEVIATSDGREAMEELKRDDAPRLAILDWIMPEMNGVDVCSAIRDIESKEGNYLILLTSRKEKGDIIAGLDAGADDYITKPFENEELMARIRTGERVINLQKVLNDKIEELQNTLDHVKTLQGIIPICSNCHKIRTDDESWQKIDNYLEEHTEVKLSHSLCEKCLDELYPPEEEEVQKDRPEKQTAD
ncbi:MAG: response regulator [Candidatus Latescibacteria bacterium]|nr:response regulator [bacterium]MBD3424324.1 response regulator [Candidatus Latescibacterota bacterium]